MAAASMAAAAAASSVLTGANADQPRAGGGKAAAKFERTALEMQFVLFYF